jgi:hypothetical protein
VLLDFVTAFSVVAAALAACLCNRTAERTGVDEVDETPPAVDLDDRDPFPVLDLERRIAVDPYLTQLEAELVPRRADDAAGGLAQMAAHRGVEDDFCYG